MSFNKPFTKPTLKNSTNSLLAQKQKEAKEAEIRLKQTNDKIALLQKQKQALNASSVQKNGNITTILIPPNLGTPMHSSKPEHESENKDGKILAATKKSETQEKIDKVKARTAELKAKTAMQKAKLEEMKKKKVQNPPQALV